MSPGTGVYHRVGQTDKGIEGIPVQMSQGIGVYHRVGQTDWQTRGKKGYLFSMLPGTGVYLQTRGKKTDWPGKEGILGQHVSRDRCVLTDQGKGGIPVQYAPRDRCVHRVRQTYRRKGGMPGHQGAVFSMSPGIGVYHRVRQTDNRHTDRGIGYLGIRMHGSQHVSRDGSVPQAAILNCHHSSRHTFASHLAVINLKQKRGYKCLSWTSFDSKMWAISIVSPALLMQPTEKHQWVWEKCQWVCTVMHTFHSFGATAGKYPTSTCKSTPALRPYHKNFCFYLVFHQSIQLQRDASTDTTLNCFPSASE